MKINKYAFLALFFLLGMTTLVACRKKESTIAKIYVRDAGNSPVAGAIVVIYGQSTTNQPSSVVLYDTTSTNAAGEAIFNFDDVYQLGQAGVAVLNIEQEVTSEETVFIQ